MTQQVHLPNQEPPVRDLTSAELDHIAGGGAHTGGINIVLADGSVRTFVDAADYVVWRKTDGAGR